MLVTDTDGKKKIVSLFDDMVFRPRVDVDGLVNPRNLMAIGASILFMSDGPSGNILHLMVTRSGPQMNALTGTGWIQRFFGSDFQLGLYCVDIQNSGVPSLCYINPRTPAVTRIREGISEVEDATPFGGWLIFTAKVDDKGRQLCAVRDSTLRILSNVVDPANPFNPRGLSVFQNRLIFSANSVGQGRQLWNLVIDNSANGFSVSRISSNPNPYFNPILDGPRNLRLSTTKLTPYVPAGTKLAEVLADDSFAPISFTYTGPGGTPFGIVGDALVSTGPIGPGEEGALISFSATNSIGISNPPVSIPITLNDNDADWLSAWFPGEEDESVMGPEADPDGDGMTNMMERFLALDPTSATFSGGTVGSFLMADEAGEGSPSAPGSLPRVETREMNGETFREYVITAPLGLTASVDYNLLASGTLSSWDSIAHLHVGFSGEYVWTGPAVDAHPVRTEILDDHVEFGVRIPETDPAIPFLKLQVTH